MVMAGTGRLWPLPAVPQLYSTCLGTEAFEAHKDRVHVQTAPAVQAKSMSKFGGVIDIILPLWA